MNTSYHNTALHRAPISCYFFHSSFKNHVNSWNSLVTTIWILHRVPNFDTTSAFFQKSIEQYVEIVWWQWFKSNKQLSFVIYSHWASAQCYIPFVGFFQAACLCAILPAMPKIYNTWQRCLANSVNVPKIERSTYREWTQVHNSISQWSIFEGAVV